MPNLTKRHRHRPPESADAVKQKGEEEGNISSEFIDGWIQSNLTISTLMVGVALTLMGLGGIQQAKEMAVYDGNAFFTADTWNDLATLSALVGFLASGAVFGWNIILLACCRSTQFLAFPNSFFRWRHLTLSLGYRCWLSTKLLFLSTVRCRNLLVRGRWLVSAHLS